MKDNKRIRVFLYFLGFNANDLKVYYDEMGVAAVLYNGNHDFLKDPDTIRHCFEEGYIDRRDSVAFVLYAYTDDPAIARSFDTARNMNIFKKKTVKFTKEEFSNLKRFKEAELTMEPLLYAQNQYVNVAMNQFEIIKVLDIDEGAIVTEWGDSTDVFEFLPMYNGFSFNDECLEESLSAALQILKFRYFLGEEEYGPANSGIQINEWSVFYLYFSDTLR